MVKSRSLDIEVLPAEASHQFLLGRAGGIGMKVYVLRDVIAEMVGQQYSSDSVTHFYLMTLANDLNIAVTW
jgi:hypothetical protein